MHNQKKFGIKVLLLHMLFKQKAKKFAWTHMCVYVRMCLYYLFPPSLWNSLYFCTLTIIFRSSTTIIL